MGKFVLKEKLERRTGTHLHLKGERCASPKCAQTRRSYPPGVHGPSGRGRLTPYGIQLREKQKAKYIFGLLERQFRRYFDQAQTKPGDTSVWLIRSLETRLDNVIFRLGFATSRRQARQMVNHGHFLVNGKSVNIPSYSVRVGDLIGLKTKMRASHLYDQSAARIAKLQIPNWLLVDLEKYEGKVVRLPEGEELYEPFDTKLIIEFYSR